MSRYISKVSIVMTMLEEISIIITLGKIYKFLKIRNRFASACRDLNKISSQLHEMSKLDIFCKFGDKIRSRTNELCNKINNIQDEFSGELINELNELTDEANKIINKMDKLTNKQDELGKFIDKLIELNKFGVKVELDKPINELSNEINKLSNEANNLNEFCNKFINKIDKLSNKLNE